MLRDMKIEDFLDRLAGDSPTPGGGSVAALSGASAAGLVSMVCNLTLGKKGYESVQKSIAQSLKRSEELRSELTEMVDLDAEAFSEIMDAYRLPKADEEEKHIRTEAIQAAVKKGTQVPLKTMELAVEVMQIALEVADTGNKNVVSDAGVAASMAMASVESAGYNVEINLKSCKNPDFKKDARERFGELKERAEKLFDATLDLVEAQLA